MNVASTAPVAADNLNDWLASYRKSLPPGHDELVGDDGQVRAHWRGLLDSFAGLTADEIRQRSSRLDRRVRDMGIAYDIFADPTKSSQRWQLDLMPIVISGAQWHWLETALIQRARLFDAMLSDLYGAQSLLSAGVLPPEVVFSDTAFLPACQNILPAAGPLQFYAADIARGTDGLWRVIDNHTETLAGIGFCLANRMAHTHVAGDLFKSANAVRVASYFQTLQEALRQRAGREDASIALLTPGARHEDYFSHGYMARYLGCLLVEGSDLRTKGSRVHLKTLEGLKDVDLILRCVDGRTCDPLELDPAGFGGPAGLLEACRDTPQLVTNAIGTAMAQNRAIAAYLPGVAQRLLGEELLLHDTPRLWLGDAGARARVFDELSKHIILAAQEGTGRPGGAALGQDPSGLSEAERAHLKDTIGLHGARLVAEERIAFSTAPALSEHGLQPKPFAIRFYVSWTGERYQVMPGGLAMTVDPGRTATLSAPDGQTRDVWVLAESEQAQHVSLWRPTVEAARVQRSQRVLQSRVADDLFWLGRYSERADWILRVLRSAYRRMEVEGGPVTGKAAVFSCMHAILSVKDNVKVAVRHRPDDKELEQTCIRLIASPGSSRSLERTVEGLFRVANLARDRVSLEAWQALTRFRPDDNWIAALAKQNPAAVLDQIDEGLSSIAAFNGIMHENMTRNFGWSFLDMGRRLERAYNLCEAILTLFTPRPDPEQETIRLQLLLEVADSFITYRSRYRLDPMLALVLDLLLLDESNPRSLAYQLSAFSSHLETLPEARQGVSLPEDRRLILGLLTSIRLADVGLLAREDKAESLEALMREQLDTLPELSNAVGRHYFSLMEDAPHRSHLRSESLP